MCSYWRGNEDWFCNLIHISPSFAVYSLGVICPYCLYSFAVFYFASCVILCAMCICVLSYCSTIATG
jgi:type IV secretory pathway VirB6-like protein